MDSASSNIPSNRKVAACRLASRPADLLVLARATRAQLAHATPQDLGTWIDGFDIALRREHSKSLLRHWSYDLNRHIALKVARDCLVTELSSRANKTKAQRKSRG